MAWPASRLTTYAASSAVKAVDLNAIQDAIMGGQHGDRTLNLSGMSCLGGITLIAGPMTVDVNGQFYIPIPLRAGDRLKTITIARKGNGVADISAADIWKTSPGGVDTSLLSFTDINPAAAFADLVLDPADYVVEVGYSVTVSCFANAAGIRIGPIRVLYDHP